MSRALRLSSQRVVLLATCFVLIATSCFAQTTLRWKFQEGLILNQTIVQEMKMSMKISDRDIVVNMNQTMDGRWKVGKIDADGVANIVQTFPRIRMKMDGAAGVNFDFDSNSDEELTGVAAALGPALKALAKSHFSLKMTPLGEIKDVKISEEIIAAFKKLPGAGQMGGMLSEEGLINMTKQAAQVFPKDPVTKGDTWTSKSEVKMPQFGKMVANTKFTYAGPVTVDGRSFERINATVTSEIKPPEGGGQMAINITEQSATGYFLFDNVAGRMSQSSMVQEMTMQIAAGGLNVNQEIEQTINVRVTPAGE